MQSVVQAQDGLQERLAYSLFRLCSVYVPQSLHVELPRYGAARQVLLSVPGCPVWRSPSLSGR